MPRIPGPRSPLAVLRFVRAADADSYRALTEAQAEYGNVIKVGPGPGLFVAMLGRDANEYILSTNTDAFRWREAMKALIPVDGDTALVVSDGADHARRRKLVQPGFHKRRIDGYLTLMTTEADRVIDTLHAGVQVDAYEVFRAAIRRTVVLALFGEHLRARADEIGDTLQPAFDFINLPPQKQIKVPLPGTKYHRARQARAAVDAIIDAEIARRQENPGAHDGADVLTMLLDARDEDGAGLTPQEIRDQVVSLVAAGYDTTSAAMAWAVHRLVTEPGVWDKTEDELDRVVGTRRISIDDLPKLPYLDGVVQETMRMHPPGVVAPRKVVAPFEFEGHRIRKGTLVLYSAYVTGRDSGCWPDPDAFRPERWDTSRSDHHDPPN